MTERLIITLPLSDEFNMGDDIAGALERLAKFFEYQVGTDVRLGEVQQGAVIGNDPLNTGTRVVGEWRIEQ